MSGALSRVAAFLVEPAAPTTADRSLPAACRVALLAPAPDATPLAAAVALTLRARERASAALVALWRGPAPRRGPATRAASRLAADAASHLPAPAAPGAPTAAAAAATPPGAPPSTAPPHRRAAFARGRLAWLALPDPPAEAVAAVRAVAAVVPGPLVTVFAGPRSAELDDLALGHDLVVVAAGPGSPLARAALARLAARGAAATACEPLRRGPSAALALAGLAAPPIRLGEPAREAAG